MSLFSSKLRERERERESEDVRVSRRGELKSERGTGGIYSGGKQRGKDKQQQDHAVSIR
jgi:hypothetical protein